MSSTFFTNSTWPVVESNVGGKAQPVPRNAFVELVMIISFFSMPLAFVYPPIITVGNP
jgi:hypothetical protein